MPTPPHFTRAASRRISAGPKQPGTGDVRPHSRGAMRPRFGRTLSLPRQRAQGEPGVRYTRTTGYRSVRPLTTPQRYWKSWSTPIW